MRLHLTGTVPVGLNLASTLEQIQSGYRLAKGEIESIRDLTRPRVDLEMLAGEKSPPGAWARLLLALQQPETSTPLLAEAERNAASLSRQAHFGAVADEPMLDPAVALEQASWRLLDTLLAQRGHGA